MRVKRWGLILALLALVGAETSALAHPSDGWLLGGTAFTDVDPENPSNEVIRIRTDIAPFFGTVSRTLNVKVSQLDNMLEFKAWFRDSGLAGKSCIGGAPRFQLAIDPDGSGPLPRRNAFGYFGASPNFTTCPRQTWLYEDLTGAGDIAITGGALFPSAPQLAPPNEELEWDLTQFGGVFYNTWSQVEAFFAARPAHIVCTVALVDDTFGAPGMTGTAYYDIISGGRATFEDNQDVAGRGFAMGCGVPNDDDDGDDENDEDHDGDVDGDDDDFDENRHEHWD